MYTVRNKINNEFNNTEYTYTEYFDLDNTVFFDIETTGFTSDNTTLYMIGCMYYSANQFFIVQWFNDDGASEKAIIDEFTSFIKDFKYIVSFNGDGFDIPYLNKKIKYFNIDFDFNCFISIDIYKKIKHLKNLLHIDNLRQKSIETFLGINREDKYSGKDLIKVYNKYLLNQDIQSRDILLQHNFEDIECLLLISPILSYTKLSEGLFEFSKMSVINNNLVFDIVLKHSIPKRISLGYKNILFTAYTTNANIKIPIIDAELKFYFDNYKDYYYLPHEDYAIHKSLAAYVDKNFKEHAKKENCYTKHKGYFITQIDNGIIDGYKKDYTDKETYIDLSDAFLQDKELINKYIKYILLKLINHK